MSEQEATGTATGSDVGSHATDSATARAVDADWPDRGGSTPGLITGLLLVLGSIVVGTRIVMAADDTVSVLVAASDLAPGQPLTQSMVEDP